jgi:hypothetical protein
MRISAVLFSLVLLVLANVAQADDAEVFAAINASSNALDEAFAKRDAKTIKELMTPDYVSVTPDGPQSVDGQIASLPELDYEQTIEASRRSCCWRPMWRCGRSSPA